MTTKYYYSYNTEEKTFSGKFPASKNPRRQSEYLLPAKATFIEPPETKENEIAIWNGKSWDVESDYRGELQVNIETKEITTVDYIGEIKEGFQKVSEELAQDIKSTPEKYKKSGDTLLDISNTDEYKEYLIQAEAEERKSEIEKELSNLDLKRIRAVCEPSIKDEETNETWLEYYNKQVIELREELKRL